MIQFLVALIITIIPFKAEAIKCSYAHSFVLKCESDKCTKAFLYQPYEKEYCPKPLPSKNNYKIFPLNMRLPFEDLETKDPVGLFGFYCMNENQNPESAYSINSKGEMTLICPKRVWKGLTPMDSKAVTIDEIKEELIQKDKDDERYYWIANISLPLTILICFLCAFIFFRKAEAPFIIIAATLSVMGIYEGRHVYNTGFITSWPLAGLVGFIACLLWIVSIVIKKIKTR